MMSSHSASDSVERFIPERKVFRAGDASLDIRLVSSLRFSAADEEHVLCQVGSNDTAHVRCERECGVPGAGCDIEDGPGAWLGNIDKLLEGSGIGVDLACDVLFCGGAEGAAGIGRSF